MTDPTASTPTAVPRTDVAIEVTGLTRSYGKVEALTGIDLRIDLGECFALLGPNGAGKTTTTEILEGYRHRDAGEVSVLGVDPAHGDGRWRSRLGHRAAAGTRPGGPHRPGVGAPLRRVLPDPRDVDEVIEAVGPRREAHGAAAARCPAGSAAGSTSRSASSADPSCCSSTSPPPASTPRHDATSGS